MNIGGKQFMNLQEAVGWLLQNNALPFQSTANYVANTEIAKSTIINPSPTEIKVGSLVLFADSKVGTVSGLTSNGFMVGPNYTDIRNALSYITNVEVDASGDLNVSLSDGEEINAGQLKQVSNASINASRHLIVTYNDGTTNDAGLIKGVSSFAINASQHLIVYYDNGTTEDLGAIFSGDVSITGKFSQGALNNSFTFNITGVGSYASSLTFTSYFTRAQIINNRLHVILNIALTNSSGSSVTLNTGEGIFTSAIFLDHASALKVFDFDAHSVGDSGSYNHLIASYKGVTTTSKVGAIYQATFDKMDIYLANRGGDRMDLLGVGNGQSIASGNSIYLSARILLDLL